MRRASHHLQNVLYLSVDCRTQSWYKNEVPNSQFLFVPITIEKEGEQKHSSIAECADDGCCLMAECRHGLTEGDWLYGMELECSLVHWIRNAALNCPCSSFIGILGEREPNRDGLTSASMLKLTRGKPELSEQERIG